MKKHHWIILAALTPLILLCIGAVSVSPITGGSGGVSGSDGNLTNATEWQTFTARGILILPPATNTALVVHRTNYAMQCYTTNADFTVTFQGTAADGVRGEFRVWNTGNSNATLTWPPSYSSASASGITSITLVSNSITRVYWKIESGSNYVDVVGKDAYQLHLSAPSAGQVLKVHATTPSLIITNLADADSGGATAWDAIGDPTGAATVAFGAHQQTISSSLDGGTVLTVTNTDPDNASDTIGIKVAFIDAADANSIFFQAVNDSDGTPTVPWQVTATAHSINVASTNSSTALVAGAAGFGSDVTIAGDLNLQSVNDPDLGTEGGLSWDANGDVLRGHDGTRQVAVGRAIEAIHVTVVLPNDLADSERDAFWVWSNESGMSFVVTGWKGWSDTDDTTLNIEEIDADGQNNATVDAVEIATNGTGLFTGADTTITAATIENGHLLVLDFDDADTPGQVKIVIYGYYAADVN